MASMYDVVLLTSKTTENKYKYYLFITISMITTSFFSLKQKTTENK